MQPKCHGYKLVGFIEVGSIVPAYVYLIISLLKTLHITYNLLLTYYHYNKILSPIHFLDVRYVILVDCNLVILYHQMSV